MVVLMFGTAAALCYDRQAPACQTHIVQQEVETYIRLACQLVHEAFLLRKTLHSFSLSHLAKVIWVFF